MNRFLKFCLGPFIAESIELTSPLNKDDLRNVIEDVLKESKGLNISGKFTRPYTFTSYPKTEIGQIQSVGVFENTTYLDGTIESAASGSLVKVTLSINPAFWIILLVLFAFIPIGLFSVTFFTKAMFIFGAIITFVLLRYYLIVTRKELLDSFKRILLFSLYNP